VVLEDSTELLGVGSRRCERAWQHVNLAKASLMGTKTAKGPVPDRAVVSATRAEMKVERSGSNWAS
jgi:hypothetical protein